MKKETEIQNSTICENVLCQSVSFTLDASGKLKQAKNEICIQYGDKKVFDSTNDR